MVLSMLGHQGLVQGSWLGLLNAQTVCVVYIVAVLQMTRKQELNGDDGIEERKESRQTTMRMTPMPKGWMVASLSVSQVVAELVVV